MEDKTIRARVDSDERMVERSFSDIAGLFGKGKIPTSSEVKRRSARSSAEEICTYFHLDVDALDQLEADDTLQLERFLRPRGYVSRLVRLEKGWWRHSRSVMLAENTDDQSFIALIPRKFDGYTFFDYRAGRRKVVNAQNARKISSHATVFTKPLPQRALHPDDVRRFLGESISLSDLWAFVVLSLVVTLLSFLVPAAYRYMIGNLVPTRQGNLVVPVFCCMTGVLLGRAFFSMARMVAGFRMGGSLELDFQQAVMNRLVYLPSAYFAKYSTGEVATQVEALGKVPHLVSNLLAESALEMVMMFALLFQANRFGGPIVWVTVLFLLAEVAVAFTSSRCLLRAEVKVHKRSSVLHTFIYNLYDGMQKLKNGGAEKRAFARWAALYRSAHDPAVVQPISLLASDVLIRTLSYLGTLVVCVMAVKMSLSEADYVAYTVAIGLIGSAFFSIVDVVQTIARIRSYLVLGSPILSSVPELTPDKHFVADLQGRIEVAHVGFSYPGQHSHVLRDCSFTIEPGDYVALVGRTGCGKSTLVKMLLGFLKLDDGAIYYDGKDLQTLDLPSLRSHIGTVMQDGKLLPGDIRSNISIMDASISDAEIQNACEIAGIWEDIQKMPMGLHTYVGEAAGGLSGGQKQRIMIARALVSHPKMMLLDEAMNALDYLTQKRISMYLEGEKCTRIIVSHRLSTIKQCSKILVLDQGRIVEAGSYEQLSVPGTCFSKLMSGHGLAGLDPA